MTTTQTTVAAEILAQLGGNKFLAMTGSYNLIADGNRLRMNLRRNKSGAKWLSIALNESDTYTMEFFTANKQLAIISKGQFQNVYNDMLQTIFKNVTGLNTSL